MIKPTFLERQDQPTVLGAIFGAPLVVKGRTGLPILELVAAGILSWVAGHTRSDWSLNKRFQAGVWTSLIMFGSEWCHNLAHTAFAKWIGKPVDAIRVFWGTPLLIYYDIDDQHVSPSQHITRALGGPAFNMLMVPLTCIARQFTRRGSLARYVADFALGTNIVISTVSLLPIPGIDGGPILKWSLVRRGRSINEADEIVKVVNRPVGCGLAVASGIAIHRGKNWLGIGLAALAATSLAIGFGLLKEQN
jgi:Zn-dependent protease